MIDTTLLPDEPGCYLYKDASGRIIYVGKARNLKKRVSSYFSKTIHDPKTRALIDAACDLDFIVTPSETEALLLENTLIKKYTPKYNIDLRDSKSYAFIHLTGDPYPRITIARKRGPKGQYFGPFVSGHERDHVFAVVKKTFMLRSCRRLPKRPCLRYHIGTCLAPCTGNVSEEEYGEQVRRAAAVMSGKSDEMIASLEKEMKVCSDELAFEKALLLRDQITAISHLKNRQIVDRNKRRNEDVVSFEVRNGICYLMLFPVAHGTLGDKEEYVFDWHEDAFEEFLVQYYATHAPPNELIVPETPGEALAAYLSAQKDSVVRVTVPQRGEKYDLLKLVAHNIEAHFFGGEAKCAALQKRLHLAEPPVVIECFDISHSAGTAMVGSMVQFRYGRPDKRKYRRFKIKTVDQIDDFAAIAEVVTRRYTRLRDEGGDYPDLIIIDGGKGQLSAATRALQEVGVRLPVISIAKREEEIYVPGFEHPLPIKKNEKASLFVQEIRDEAHRFAIQYNRLLRRKEVTG